MFICLGKKEQAGYQTNNANTSSQLRNSRVDKVEVKLQLRVGDVEFWKGELDNKLAQLKEEIEEVSFVNFLGYRQR